VFRRFGWVGGLPVSIKNQVEAAKVGVQDDELEGEKLTDQKRRHQAWLRQAKTPRVKLAGAQRN